MYAFLPSLSSKNLTVYFLNLNISSINQNQTMVILNIHFLILCIQSSAFQKLFVEQICSTYIDLFPINVSDVSIVGK